MRKAIIGCGVLLFGFMLAFSTYGKREPGRFIEAHATTHRGAEVTNAGGALLPGKQMRAAAQAAGVLLARRLALLTTHRERRDMRKVIVGCGVFLIGFMLALSTSTARANPERERPAKPTPPGVDKPQPQPPTQEGFCMPPGTHCAPAKPQGFCFPPGSCH